jgi:competence protein ComEC
MLKVHFLNVGHGDCTIIRHPDGRLTMIDINNAEDLDPTTAQELRLGVGGRIASSSIPTFSFMSDPQKLVSGVRMTALRETVARLDKGCYNAPTNPIEFMKTQNYKSIFRYIQTHPDLDHMRGLIALRDAGYEITNFWDTEHDKHPDFFSTSDTRDWKQYQLLRSGRYCKVLNLFRGGQNNFWSKDGIEILSPTPEIIRLANLRKNWNNLSYVLRLTYGGISVIFGGDAEEDVWKSIVKKYGNNLKCNILKASHHGRDSGYYQEAVKLMSPEYTIVSVGKKPSTDAHQKYNHYSSNKVLSTRWRGDITLQINSFGQGEIFTEYDR